MWYYLQKKRHGRVIVNEKLIMNGLSKSFMFSDVFCIEVTLSSFSVFLIVLHKKLSAFYMKI